MSTCVKWFVSLGLLGLVLGCGGVSPANNQQFGKFSFTVPDGWTSVAPDREKTKAMLLFGGTDWQTAKAMLKVDVGEAVFSTPEEMANNFAKSAGGEASHLEVDFDGERGIRVTTGSTDMTRPRETIVIHHDGKVYMVMASAAEGVDLTDALELVRATWNWE